LDALISCSIAQAAFNTWTHDRAPELGPGNTFQVKWHSAA